ncbi:MAG TPA: class I SAM-dependent methyltransferase, partial [Granulicella sp.]
NACELGEHASVLDFGCGDGRHAIEFAVRGLQATGVDYLSESINTARSASLNPGILDYHLKTGHTLSVQNRPTGLAEDVTVVPCYGVRLQGLGLSPRSGL